MSNFSVNERDESQLANCRGRVAFADIKFLASSQYRNIAISHVLMFESPCARQVARFLLINNIRVSSQTYRRKASRWMSLDVSCMRLSKIVQGETCGRVPIWCYWLFACIWLYSRATFIRMKTFKVQRSSLVCLQNPSDILALHFPLLIIILLLLLLLPLLLLLLL